jgi:hypothetical protein
MNEDGFIYEYEEIEEDKYKVRLMRVEIIGKEEFEKLMSLDFNKRSWSSRG